MLSQKKNKIIEGKEAQISLLKNENKNLSQEVANQHGLTKQVEEEKDAEMLRNIELLGKYEQIEEATKEKEEMMKVLNKELASQKTPQRSQKAYTD